MTASWICAAGCLAQQLRESRGMLDGKHCGNSGCIPSPNNSVLKHFTSRSAQETLGQTVSNPAFAGSPATQARTCFPPQGICCGTKCVSCSGQQPAASGGTWDKQEGSTSNMPFFPDHANFLNKLFALFGSKPVFAACDLKSK